MKLTWVHVHVQTVLCNNMHKNHLQQKKISLGFTLQHKLGVGKKITESVNQKVIKINIIL